IRQRDRSTAGLGLDVHLDESPALSLRAHMSMLLARLLALLGSVVSRAAGVRIGASVLPLLSLQCLPDTQRPVLLVEVLPLQPERFALPHTECQRDDVTNSIAAHKRRGKEPFDLLLIERLDFFLLDTRRFREARSVARDDPAAFRLTECRACRAMDLVCSAGLEPGFQHAHVELLEMLGLDPLHLLGSAGGAETPEHTRFVAAHRLVLRGQRDDVRDPMA